MCYKSEHWQQEIERFRNPTGSETRSQDEIESKIEEIRKKANNECLNTHQCGCFPNGQENLPLQQVQLEVLSTKKQRKEERTLKMQYVKNAELCGICKCHDTGSRFQPWELKECFNKGLPNWHQFYEIAAVRGLDLRNEKAVAKMEELANFECASERIGGCTCQGTQPNVPVPKDYEPTTKITPTDNELRFGTGGLIPDA